MNERVLLKIYQIDGSFMLN